MNDPVAAAREGNVADEGAGPESHLQVRDLTMAYGSFVLQRDLTFDVNRGDIFIIMGGSGCGKSTLLRHLIGLKEPAKGEIFYGGESFTAASDERRACCPVAGCGALRVRQQPLHLREDLLQCLFAKLKGLPVVESRHCQGPDLWTGPKT